MLKGPMIIDLGKAARKAKAVLHAAEKALDWQGWNNANPLHPKGADGRWSSGHPSVGVVGGTHEHLHELSDDDLHAMDRHVGTLATALTEEIGRRKIQTVATKRIPTRDIRASQGGVLPIGVVPEPGERGGRVWTRRGPGTYLGPDSASDQGDTTYVVELDDGHGGMMTPVAIQRINAAGDGPAVNGEDWRGGQSRIPFPHQAFMPNPAKPLRATGRGKVVAPEVSAELDEMVRRPMPSDRERMKELLGGMTVAQIHEFVGRHMDTPASGKNKAQLVTQATEHTIGFQLNSEAIRHGLGGSTSSTGIPDDPRRAEIRTGMRAANESRDRAEYERLHNEMLASVGGYKLEPGSGSNKTVKDGEFGDRLREKRINDLTHKINDPSTDPMTKVQLGAERAGLAGPAMFGDDHAAIMNTDLSTGLGSEGTTKHALLELPATAEGSTRARAMLQGMTVPQLKKLRKEIGSTVSQTSTTKKQIIEDIQEGTVGFRARSAASGGAFGEGGVFGLTSKVTDDLDGMTKGKLIAEYSGKGPRIHSMMPKSEMITEIRRWKAGEPERAAARAITARENEPFIRHLEDVRGELPDRNYGTAVDEILAKLRSGEYSRWEAYHHAGTAKVMKASVEGNYAEQRQGHRIMDEFRQMIEYSENETGGAGPKD